jgi:hypothetical protein
MVIIYSGWHDCQDRENLTLCVRKASPIGHTVYSQWDSG